MNVGECRYLELTVSITNPSIFYIYPSDFAGGYAGEDAYTIINTATGETIAKTSVNTFTISEAGTYTLVISVNTFTISEAGTYTLVIKATKTQEGSVNAPKAISFTVSWK